MDAADIAIRAGIIGGVAGGLAVVLIGFFTPRRTCRECQAPLPKVRKPSTRRQMLWGGWTCPECGCEMDRKGRKIEE